MERLAGERQRLTMAIEPLSANYDRLYYALQIYMLFVCRSLVHIQQHMLWEGGQGLAQVLTVMPPTSFPGSGLQ